MRRVWSPSMTWKLQFLSTPLLAAPSRRNSSHSSFLVFIMMVETLHL
ncbi:hypothetical protein EYF80_059142 [Liparis tanakae]|uniref:Uncharacterized protein n=1 Tax=Liparis tanakae TaxID=230148 RepID=A0A4Z2EPJ1_9TELE|nr:hypothetical protein EYF80_059142 [Liparis tanakae]